MTVGVSPDRWLGVTIQHLRTRDGFTQEGLAAELGPLGWNGATVAKIESGARSLKATELLFLQMRLRWEWADLTRHQFDIDDAIASAPSRTKSADAIRRAAAALDVSTSELDRMAMRAWGVTFLTERGNRLAARLAQGEPAGVGATGRISRAMVEELRGHLPARRKGKGR